MIDLTIAFIEIPFSPPLYGYEKRRGVSPPDSRHVDQFLLTKMADIL